jgi:hypothetical protein
MDPEINADHVLALDCAAGLFEYFADNRLLG